MASIDRENPAFLRAIQQRNRDEELRRMKHKFDNEVGGDYHTAKEQWRIDHTDVIAWIEDNLTTSNFASSLGSQYARGGNLTERQIAAVRNILEREKQRATAAVAAASYLAGATSVQLTGLDLSSVPDGRYAVPDGDTRLKVQLRRPKPPSRWVGYTFVSDGAHYGMRKNYGRQAPGRLYEGEIVPALREIAKDPRAAAIAYGKLTGTCAICGRVLEDEESVARGIGPICAGRYNW